MTESLPPFLRGDPVLVGLALVTIVLLGILWFGLWWEPAESRAQLAATRLQALAFQQAQRQAREAIQSRLLATELQELLARTPDRAYTTEELMAAVAQPRAAVVISLRRLQGDGQVELVDDGTPQARARWRIRGTQTA